MCSSAPQLLYYIYIPIIALVLFTGIFVYISNRKLIKNRLFFTMSIVIASWLLFCMLNFENVNPEKVLLFDRLAIIGVLVPVMFLLFAYHFSSCKYYNLSLGKTAFIFISVLPFLIFSTTKYNIIRLTSPPECDSVAGPLYWFSIPFIIFYLVWSFFVFYGEYKKGDENIKNQIKIILFGFLIGFLWAIITSIFPLIFVNFEMLTLLAPLGVLFLIGSVFYAIVQYKFLNIKLLGTQALVFALVFLIGSQFFFIRNSTNMILNGITLVLVTGFGYMLIKSVKSEVQRKEELQRMSDELAKTNDQLRKLDNAKSEFISIASHQLRTPLTAIKGFISLLLEGSYGKLQTPHLEVLNKVYLSNERLINLVEDLLNISRIESGRMEYNFARWDISKMCLEVVDTFLLRAKERNLYLDYKNPEHSLPEAMTDGGKLREVISNLIDNALKYTQRGGVSVRVNQEGDKIRIAVSDTGIGIPDEELPYLFSKFSRGKDTNRLNTGGTGLGLYVGKSMVESLGGKIWAESEGAGKGSKFIVEIPIERTEENPV